MDFFISLGPSLLSSYVDWLCRYFVMYLVSSLCMSLCLSVCLYWCMTFVRSFVTLSLSLSLSISGYIDLYPARSLDLPLVRSFVSSFFRSLVVVRSFFIYVCVCRSLCM